MEEEEELGSSMSNPNNDRGETSEMVSINDTFLLKEKRQSGNSVETFRKYDQTFLGEPTC